MSLRRRMLHTVAFNLALLMGLPTLFHASRWVTLWGAYRGWWPLGFNLEM
jgi:hypothetical protein